METEILLEVKEANCLNARIVKTQRGLRLEFLIEDMPGGASWEIGGECMGHSAYAYGQLMLKLAEGMAANGQMIKDGSMDVEI